MTQQAGSENANVVKIATAGGSAPEVCKVQPQTLTILGATGSIGQSTLDLVACNPNAYDINCVTAHKNYEELAVLARRHNAKRAAIADHTQYQNLKEALSGTDIKVSAGEDAVADAASEDVDCTVAAIVGAAGLRPAFAALANGKRMALANKECLVCAGDVFMSEVQRTQTELLPIDSEHSAVFQTLANADHAAIESITLTASGGPFRDWPVEKLASATVRQALNHPNWSMGNKITIDSATMMNKGLELIEAYHLFPVGSDKIDVVVHPQSIVHCLVSFIDGSVIAQMAEPDMRTPISLALSWPRRMSAPTKRLNLTEIGKLTFEQPDENRFPALALARKALERGGAAPAVLNAANERAVEAFLAGKVKFLQISEVVSGVMGKADSIGLIQPLTNIAEALEIDREARHIADMEILAAR